MLAILRKSIYETSVSYFIIALHAKYVNAIALYRLEQEFKRYGLAITRQNMANWIIRLGEEYIAVMWDYLHGLLYRYHVIQADETLCLVNRDGRPAGSKSYMWVYRSGYMYTDRPSKAHANTALSSLLAKKLPFMPKHKEQFLDLI